MKKTITFLIIGIIIIILAGLLGFFIENILSPEPSEIKISQEETGQEIILIIDDGQLSKEFSAEYKERMTAFDLLKEKTEEIGLTLKFKTYDVGVFIEAIGDKENGENEKYWLYYINGEMPQVAADKQLLSLGDKVEFKFEKSPF